MRSNIAGILAGLIATAPMTAFMEYAHHQLPLTERQALPPRTITLRVVDALHIKGYLDQKRRKALTVASHFAFGAAAGSLFGPIARTLKGSNTAKGAAYGVAVWAVNYLGILPAFGLTKSAANESPRRTALMVGAHVVWGVALGVMSDKFLKRRPRLRSFSATPVGMVS